jgi:hypothetical protein
MTTYYLIQKKSYYPKETLEQRSKRCSQFSDYEILSNVQDGILYYDGSKIDLNEFYNGNIKIIEDTNSINTIDFLDLLDF